MYIVTVHTVNQSMLLFYNINITCYHLDTVLKCFLLAGIKGEQGMMGFPGLIGEKGDRGPVGLKGNTGPTGKMRSHNIL